MTDNMQHIDVDSDEFLDAPKALRDHVKKLQQANTRLTETNADLSGRLTASALTDVLSEFKNPERVKRDLLSDKVDPLNSEAVKTWLSENAGDYARGEATSTTDNHTTVTPEEQQAHQRIADSTAGLQTPADLSKLEAALAEVPANATGADLIAAYQKHGA